MNDVNDKLIEGLEEANKRIAEKDKQIDKLNLQIGDLYVCKTAKADAFSIVNDLTDMGGDYTRLEDIPKQIIISDYHYAFVKDENGYGLWIWNDDQWGEVSDLTGVYVFEYQKLKSYMVAIGWITEDEDLFI